jgi:pilus assembly protein CpaB
MKLAVAGLLFLGVLAALCAAVLVGTLRIGVSPAHASAERDADVTILLAAHDLPAMALITADGVTTKTVPRSKAPQGYLTNPVQVVGKVLAVPVVEGQAFSTSSFAAEGVGAMLAASLHDGKRAVGIPVTDCSGLEGLLYPGSIVDVVASFKPSTNSDGQVSHGPMSITVLQGVEVLAIEKQTIVSPDAEKGADADALSRNGNAIRRVTLLVDSRQARVVQLASQEGTLSLALRNPLDSTPDAGKAISLREVIGEPDRPRVQGPSLLDQAVTAWVAYGQQLKNRPTPAPAITPTTRPATWDTIIMHGQTVETRSFPLSWAHADGRGER